MTKTATIRSYPKPTPGLAGTIGEVYRGVKSLFVGLGVTGKRFVSPIITTRYPVATVEPTALAGYRGHIELVGKPKNPAEPKCIVCMMCVKVCPSKCIALKAAKPEPEPSPPKNEDDAGMLVAKTVPTKPPSKKKTPGAFTLDYTLCSLCGLCVQNCPVDSLRHSMDIYIASYERAPFDSMDMLARLKRQADQVAAAKPAPATKSETAPETTKEEVA